MALAGWFTPVHERALSPQTFRRGGAHAAATEARGDRVGPGRRPGTLGAPIEELRADADLHLEITTDETDLVKLTFSGTPSVGYPLRREVRDIPGEVVRRLWNEGLRDYDTV